jgi:hypothetical protein
MIEVFICLNEEPLGYIKIANTGESIDDTSNYLVQFGIDRGSSVGVHSRLLHFFPRKKYNVFALLLQALQTLNEKELELESGYDIDSPEALVPADLARRFSGTVREIQAKFSRSNRHRSSFRDR